LWIFVGFFFCLECLKYFLGRVGGAQRERERERERERKVVCVVQESMKMKKTAVTSARAESERKQITNMAKGTS